MNKACFTSLLLSAVFSVTTAPALAEDIGLPADQSNVSQTQTYTPDYFDQFAPLTAADMVARLPGFEIRGGDDGERGFGQASLNILINGRRPSSKSSGANQILGRIPAGNVTQIDIVDGAALNIPGLSGQVANIIAKTGDFSGSWSYAARFEKGSQPQWGDGAINFSGKTGNVEAVGSLDFGQFIFTEDGDETFFDETGQLTQDRREKIGFNTQRPRANLNLTLLRDNGHIANLNLSAERQNRNIDLIETFEDQTDPTLSGRSAAKNGNDRDTYEVGSDYSLNAALLGRDGQLKLIVLHRTSDAKFTSHFLFDDGAPGQTSSLFSSAGEEREYIGRSEYSWKTGETSDWTASLEGALNSLKSTTELSEDDGDVSTDFVEVEETRLQGNISRNWALNPKINLQVSVGAEYSIINVKTEDRESPSFFRPKGLLNASYKLDESWTLRGQIERSVGQLNFDTFVSNVSLAEGTATQGNDEIVPEQRWEAELELQRQNPTGLSGRTTLFYENVEDPIEQLLFTDSNGDIIRDDDGNILQGPGNLDTNAQVYGVRTNLTWVLDDILKGLRISADGTLADSSVRDIVTDDKRATNRQQLWNYEIEARWDIDGTPFALEAEIEQGKQSDVLRIDQVFQNDFIRPEVEFSLIHKDLLGMQWTVKLQNIVDFEFRRQRSIFEDTRNGDLIRREDTRRKRGQRISFEVTDTF